MNCLADFVQDLGLHFITIMIVKDQYNIFVEKYISSVDMR